jgi:hypothetical protein
MKKRENVEDSGGQAQRELMMNKLRGGGKGEQGEVE